MWPEISLSKRSIDNMGYRVCQLPEEDATIKEIVMIFDDSIPTEVLTDIYRDALKYIPKDPSERSDIPEDVRRHLVIF